MWPDTVGPRLCDRYLERENIMTELTLKVLRADNTTAAVSRGMDEAYLVFSDEYKEGDRIILESSEKNIHLVWQVDDALGNALVYITKKTLSYQVPFGEKKICYSPKVFSGNKHYLYARLATADEVKAYRNLALNPLDQHGDTCCYPHATANVENRSHGEWPYASWGINRDPDACLKLDFGREVEVDKIVLVTRADFPHDSWWTQATFNFSDGSAIDFPMEKSDKGHVCSFEKKKISWLTLNKLIKADDPSPFPALTQIEVYGTEA